MWTVVPAPTVPILALAVLVPELTPWLLLLCIVAGAIAQSVARGWARDVGVFCAALALGFALLPWCLLARTIDDCNREMQTAFGTPHGSPAAGGRLERPYSLAIAMLGDRNTARIRTLRERSVPLRDGRQLFLDVYAPALPGPHPAIVIVYGGAWIFGSRADSANIAQMYARDGYTAVAIDYRHAPAYRYPTQINDVRDAIAEIARHADAWQIDPAHVTLLGRSAGAQLALLAAYLPEPISIRAVVAYYAPTDLARGYRDPPNPDPADVDRILRAYTGGTPDERSDIYATASPVNHVRAALPPTLLIGGGRDELVRLLFAHELRSALRKHGNRVAALDLPWSNHAFDSIPNGTAGQLARFYTERFLSAVL